MKTKHTMTLLTTAALVGVTTFGVLRGTRPAQAMGTTTMVAETDHPTVPAGIYTTTITPADIPPDFPPEVAAILVGQWETELTADGENITSKDGEVVVSGHYTASPFRVVVTDEAGPLACFDAHGIATGIYTWSFENGELVLTPVLDRCFGRQFVLTTHPLQKQ